MRRIASVAPRVFSYGLFALALVWPCVALIGQCLIEGSPPDGGFTLSQRQWALLARSVGLAASATGLCLAFSIPAAFVVGRSSRLSDRPILAAAMLGLLLCPPTVYAMGWERVLPSTFHPYLRCVGVWALWAWPIPALVIGSGWSRVGRPVYQAALMVATPRRAFLCVAFPQLIGHVALSGLIVFVLFLNEYGVPHSCLLTVYATELLGWAASSSRPIDTVWPSWPVVAVTGLAFIAIWRTWLRSSVGNAMGQSISTASGSSHGFAGATIGVLVISWLIPIGALAVRLESSGTIVEALSTYRGDLAWSAALAILGGAASVAMAMGFAAKRRLLMFGLSWSLMLGALPGALVGASLVAAFNNHLTGPLYDHWPIVVLSYVARFSWIGFATAMLIVESTERDLLDQALIDGADYRTAFSRIQFAIHWPTLCCAGAIIAAMSLSDVSASSLVRVPSFSPIAHVLMEKFHRFEDGMLVSLSLILVLAALPPATILALTLRRA